MCTVIGIVLLALGTPERYGPPPPSDTVSTPRTPPPDAPAGSERTPPLPRSAPTALNIPAIGLRTAHLVGLGLTPDRRLEAPREWEAVGWYTLGAAPGQVGPAVLAGHLDSPDGPAVFHRLGELRDGDAVSVERADGSVARFTVYAVEQHAKDDFPTQEVYGATSRPELRLITCGGAFDAATGHYTDNVVVRARLTAPSASPGSPAERW
ncbi:MULTISPECIES: class F sortase [unclassified Nocardiopsis]|uniref:class F sortase n=1 Tax=unclassified Nocardiopsis TaxID=2649073 RepID=UPI00135C1D0F|nr:MULTISPECIES: class F sortase [unclassified Nocardiopsis]